MTNPKDDERRDAVLRRMLATPKALTNAKGLRDKEGDGSKRKPAAVVHNDRGKGRKLTSPS